MLHYQIATALSWFPICLMLVPATFRTIRGRARDSDEWKALAFFLGSLTAFLSLRWVFWPESLLVWKMLYVTSIAAALLTGLMILNSKLDRRRSNLISAAHSEKTNG